MSPPRRYASVATLLEYTLPGSGAMYAGQLRIGVLWLIITLLGNAAFLVLMFTGITGYAGDLSSVAFIIGCMTRARDWANLPASARIAPAGAQIPRRVE